MATLGIGNTRTLATISTTKFTKFVTFAPFVAETQPSTLNPQPTGHQALGTRHQALNPQRSTLNPPGTRHSTHGAQRFPACAETPSRLRPEASSLCTVEFWRQMYRDLAPNLPTFGGKSVQLGAKFPACTGGENAVHRRRQGLTPTGEPPYTCGAGVPGAREAGVEG